MRVLMLAGGGGHTGYTYALAQKLHGKAELHFLVPEGDMLSYARLKRFGEINFLVKPRKTPDESKIKFLYGLLKSYLYSRGNVKGYDVVVSSGSNFCLMPSIVASKKGIFVVNIESPIRFTKPAKTVQFLRRYSKLTVVWWETQRKIIPEAEVYPLLPEPEYPVADKGYILITLGTIGSKELLDTVLQLDLDNVVVQTGSLNVSKVKERHPNWKVFNYSPEFGRWIAGASVVVSHFGYTAVEAVAYGKPVVLIPEKLKIVSERDSELFAEHIGAVLLRNPNTEMLMEAVEKARKRKVKVESGSEKLAEKILMWGGSC